MTNLYSAMCAELLAALESEGYAHWSTAPDEDELCLRARALLAQPVTEEPKPMVDYSRVPEIATEAQIRSAAQYLVKKRNCDGDLIPAIEYAIARWGTLTPQPVPVSERLPGPEDCDEQGRCWWFAPDADEKCDEWCLDAQPAAYAIPFYGYTHWLPASALPTPEA